MRGAGWTKQEEIPVQKRGIKGRSCEAVRFRSHSINSGVPLVWEWEEGADILRVRSKCSVLGHRKLMIILSAKCLK